MTIYPNDMLTPTFLMGVIRERPYLDHLKGTYIWRRFFPEAQTPERRITWESVRAQNRLAGLYDSKSPAIPMSDELFSTYFADLIDIRAAKDVNPDILSKIRDAGMPAVYKAAGETSFTIQGIMQRIQQHIAEAINICDNAIEATLEYFAMNALLGQIPWPPKDANGNSITNVPHWNPKYRILINFPRYQNFAQDATTLVGYGSKAGTQVAWNATGAKPVRDLEIIAELMDEQEGIDMDGATVMMSRGTMTTMAETDTFLQWINAYPTFAAATETLKQGAKDVAGYKEIQNFLLTKTGLNIELYRGSYTYETAVAGTRSTITRMKFLPDGVVLVIPKGESSEVGNMMFAPHETEDGSWVYGKAARVYRDPKTYDREIEEHTVAWPVVKRGMEVFRLNSFS